MASNEEILNLTLNTDSLLQKLNQVEAKLKDLQKAAKLDLQLSGDPDKDLRQVQRAKLKALGQNPIGIKNNELEGRANLAQFQAQQKSPAGQAQLAKDLAGLQTAATKSVSAYLQAATKQIQAAQVQAIKQIESGRGGSGFKQQSIDQVASTIAAQRQQAQKQADLIQKQTVAATLARQKQAIQNIEATRGGAGFKSQAIDQIGGQIRKQTVADTLAAQKQTIQNIEASRGGPGFQQQSFAQFKAKTGGLSAFTEDQGPNQNPAIAGTLSHFLGGGAKEPAGGGGGGSALGAGEFIGGLAKVAGTAFIAEKAFEAISGAMKDVVDAGLAFQNSIVAIAGVLQETTDVSGTIQEQVETQTANARNIQLTARKALVPLGIGGEAESALVRSLVSGSAQKGIALTADQAGKLSERVGAAIVTLRPDLKNQPIRIQKDTEDILTNPGRARSTSLGTALQGVAPGIFTAGSAEDLLKATEGLDKLTQAYLNSSLGAVQLTRTLGGLGTVYAQVGDTFIQALQPGLKALADALSGDKITEELVVLAKGFGAIADPLIALGAVSLTALGEGLEQLYNTLREIGSHVGLSLPALSLQKADGSEGGTPNLRTQLAGALNGTGLKPENVSSDTVLQSSPEYISKQLEKAFNLVVSHSKDGGVGANLAEDVLPAIVNKLNEQLDKTVENFRKTQDEDTLAGKLAVQEKIIDIATEKNANLQEVINTQPINSPLAQAAVLGQAQNNQTINAANRAEIAARLENVAGLHQLRDAEKSLSDATASVARNLPAFGNALVAAQQAVDEFDKRVSTAGKENDIIEQAKKVQELGGTVPGFLGSIVDDPGLTKEYQLKSASAALNQSLKSVGIPGVGIQGGAPDFVSQTSGGSFQTGLQGEQIKLQNAVGEAAEALRDVALPARNAAEALAQLGVLKDKLFPSNVSTPSQVIGPGGVLTGGVGNTPPGTAGGNSNGSSGAGGASFPPVSPALVKLLTSPSASNPAIPAGAPIPKNLAGINSTSAATYAQGTPATATVPGLTVNGASVLQQLKSQFPGISYTDIHDINANSTASSFPSGDPFSGINPATPAGVDSLFPSRYGTGSGITPQPIVNPIDGFLLDGNQVGNPPLAGPGGSSAGASGSGGGSGGPSSYKQMDQSGLLQGQIDSLMGLSPAQVAAGPDLNTSNQNNIFNSDLSGTSNLKASAIAPVTNAANANKASTSGGDKDNSQAMATFLQQLQSTLASQLPAAFTQSLNSSFGGI